MVLGKLSQCRANPVSCSETPEKMQIYHISEVETPGKTQNHPSEWQCGTWHDIEQPPWAVVGHMRWLRATPVSSIGTHGMTQSHFSERKWNIWNDTNTQMSSSGAPGTTISNTSEWQWNSKDEEKLHQGVVVGHLTLLRAIPVNCKGTPRLIQIQPNEWGLDTWAVKPLRQYRTTN